jgi:hypothetical protein
LIDRLTEEHPWAAQEWDNLPESAKFASGALRIFFQKMSLLEGTS